jgi:TonB family protein
MKFSERLQETLPLLLSHLWTSTLFLILVLLVFVLLRRRLTAGARFTLALIGIVKFAIPAAAVLPLVRFLAEQRMQPDAPLNFPLAVVGGAFPVRAVATSTPAWVLWLCAIWIAVALIVMARFVMTRHRLVSLATRTAVAASVREVEALARAKERIGVRTSIDIARSALPEAPAVLRTIRPLLVLPLNGCDDLSDDELESLLCHECAHVARHDNLIARVESLICALFWFHPLIWIAQRITVIERERACDEAVVVASDAQRTYLAALTKFCHARIAPRLPGVSCMATSKLRERMDHVMNYPALKEQSPSPRRIGGAAVFVLVLFTVASAFVAVDRALAVRTDSGPYSVRMTASSSDNVITLSGQITENATGTVVAAPKVALREGSTGASTSASGDLEVILQISPGTPNHVAVDVKIVRAGEVVQRDRMVVRVSDAARPQGQKYTGAPISLDLKDSDLKDIIGVFGKLTGMEMVVDPAVRGRVSVQWNNVPWDQAFDELLTEQGLTYRIEGSRIHVTPRPATAATSNLAGYERPGSGVIAPQVIQRVEPVYPDAARAARISGAVVVEAMIDTSGNVVDTKVLKPLPYGLDQAALDAVKQWRFAPATKDGVPVPVVFTLTFNFQAEEKDR